MTHKRDREIRFESVDIYYNYVFDLGHFLNPIDAARRLLESDLGQSFCNYVTGECEVADYYRPIFDGYEQLVQLRDDAKGMHAGGGFAPFLRFALRHPRLAGKSLVQTLSTLRRTPAKSSAGRKDDNPPIEDAVKSMHQLVQDSVFKLSGVLRIHEHVDRTIFSPLYLEGPPFVRINLEMFTATVAGQSVAFDVTVAIHRCGVAILTAYGLFEGSFSADELIQLRRAKTPLSALELPSVVVRRDFEMRSGRQAFQHLPEADKGKLEGRQHFAVAMQPGLMTLEDVFLGYRLCVADALASRPFRSEQDVRKAERTSLWRVYPVIFVKKTTPGYSIGADFKKSHSDVLARLLTDLGSMHQIRPEVIEKVCAEDLSAVDTQSLYVSEGLALQLFYGNPMTDVPAEYQGSEWIRKKFLSTVLIDVLLFQQQALSAFHLSLNAAPVDVQWLMQRRAEYLQMLEEFEALDLVSFGTATEILQHGHKVMHITDARKLFLLKLENIESLIRVADARHQTNREWRIKALTTIATVVLSLPAAQGVVNVIRSWPSASLRSYPAVLQAGYNWVVNEPVEATLLLYGLLLVVSLVTLWNEVFGVWGKHRRVVQDSTGPKTRAKAVPPFSVSVHNIEGQPDPHEEEHGTNSLG